jgi:hypothetical protein
LLLQWQVDGGRSKRQLSDASDEEAPPAKTQAVDSGGGGGGPRKMAPPKPSVSQLGLFPSTAQEEHRTNSFHAACHLEKYT